MKKGFTLVELLAVLVILSLIAIITIPNIQNALYSSQDEAYNMTVSQFKLKTNDYVMDNNLDAQITSTVPLDVYLYQLVDNGYIEDKDLVDPRTPDTLIDKTTSYVHVTLVGGDLEYTDYFTSISTP